MFERDVQLVLDEYLHGDDGGLAPAVDVEPPDARRALLAGSSATASLT